MGNLLVDGFVKVNGIYFDNGRGTVATKPGGWNEFKDGPKSLYLTIGLDLVSNGDVSFLLDENGYPCKVKINNYIMEQLKNGI